MPLDRNTVDSMIMRFSKMPISIDMIKAFTQACYDDLDTAIHSFILSYLNINEKRVHL